MKRKILLLLLVIHVFFMFYNLEKWAPFGWDQVDNAWTSMRMITKHQFPLIGMVAKQNTGIHIGPLYYYFVAFFYLLTKLNPIAAPIIAGTTSIFSFFVLYVVSKKLFSARVAIFSLFIYTFSSFIITTERVQWPVNFIAPISLLILYYLYKSITEHTKYLLHLGVLVGLSFHIHFTAIFYPLIILASLPFIKWGKKAILYLFGSIGIVVLFFIPQMVFSLQHPQGQFFNSYKEYARTQFHGLHATRILQLLPDAFIKFQSVLMNPYGFVKYISAFFLPIFILLYRKKLGYLISLWFLVPWIVFATYKGEISDYYFSLQTYIVICILSCLTIYLWDKKLTIIRIIILLFWAYWTIINISEFFKINESSFIKNKQEARIASETARIINFTEGDPLSYLYYYYMYIGKKWLPYTL